MSLVTAGTVTFIALALVSLIAGHFGLAVVLFVCGVICEAGN